MSSVAAAVASVCVDLTPRIAGTTYDWDLWPGRVAAGASPFMFETWRLTQNIKAVQRAIGLPLYEVARRLASVAR